MKTKDYLDAYGWMTFPVIVIYKCFYRVLFSILEIFCKNFLRIDKKIVVFFSEPDYADNSRALSEYMVNNGYAQKYDIYFCVDDVNYCHRHFGEAGVKFIQRKNNIRERKISTYYLLHRAHYLFGTHKTAPNRLSAKKDQRIINLWHGCSFKDKTSYDGNTDRKSDLYLVAGDLFVDTKSHFWNIDKKYIAACGYPRYDWLLEKSDKAIEFANALKMGSERLIMWMPTFRNDKNGKYNETENITQFPLIGNNESWKILDEFCKSKRITLVIKLHPKQKKYSIPFDTFTNIINVENGDFDKVGIQMYQFIALTDALISDYSSIGVDYLIVDKPLAYTLDDYNLYKDGRGFIVENPLQYMPGHHLYKFQDLMDFINDISNNNDVFKNDRAIVSKKIVHKSDHYCKDIIEMLEL